MLYQQIHFYTYLVKYGLTVVTATISMFAEPAGDYKSLDAPVVRIMHFPVFFINKNRYTNNRQTLQNPCPESEAGFLSQITFSWMSNMILMGWKSPLTRSDLWTLSKENSAEDISRVFEEAKKNKNPP